MGHNMICGKHGAFDLKGAVCQRCMEADLAEARKSIADFERMGYLRKEHMQAECRRAEKAESEAARLREQMEASAYSHLALEVCIKERDAALKLAEDRYIQHRQFKEMAEQYQAERDAALAEVQGIRETHFDWIEGRWVPKARAEADALRAAIEAWYAAYCKGDDMYTAVSNAIGLARLSAPAKGKCQHEYREAACWCLTHDRPWNHLSSVDGCGYGPSCREASEK